MYSPPAYQDLHSGHPLRSGGRGESGVGDDVLEGKFAIFIGLAADLQLTRAEERTLLDISLPELIQLRAEPGLCGEIGGAKLRRRLDYAIRLLRRMLAAGAS